MKTAHEFAPLLIGRSKDDAERMAAENGFITRVVMEDGFQYYVDSRAIMQRINIILIDGKIIEVSVG